MRKLLPLILLVLGVAGGGAAGLMLKPEPQPDAPENPCGDVGTEEEPPEAETEAAKEGREYVKFNNQFVIPVMGDGRVAALVVMSLSVEVGPGQREEVYAREPKLRDAFLQVMFDHANMGGFEGNFTASARMGVLRMALLEVAQSIFGPGLSDVLVVDIARQDY